MEVFREYLGEVVGRLEGVFGEELVSVIWGGSYGLGDFRGRSSDLDVMVVVKGVVEDGVKRQVGEELSHSVLACPGLGLDLGVYRVAELENVQREPVYEMSFCTGSDWEDELELGGEYPGALIDFEICRCGGETAFGLGAGEMIGEVPCDWLREELIGAVRWHQRYVHDGFHDPYGVNAVLNGCRVLAWMRTGELVSKTEGAGWLLGEVGEREIVREGLEMRKTGVKRKLDIEEVEAFLEWVLGECGAG